MMKFLFNVARNLSLAIVLIAAICLFLLFQDGTFMEGVWQEVNERRQEQHLIDNEKAEQLPSLAQLEVNETYEPANFAVEGETVEEVEFAEEVEEFGIFATPEMSSQTNSDKKIKLPIIGGSAYLRPMQVMYISTAKFDSLPNEIQTVQDQTILTKFPISKIADLLDADGEKYFFRTKSAILNCNYVQQLRSENVGQKINKTVYHYFVIMEDDKRINLGAEKHRALKKRLEDFF